MWHSVRMSDQLRMHTPKEPRAAGSREAEHCDLDLTSVCVRSGVVQLPSRMLAWFAAGATARANGEDLAIDFTPPRALGGLLPFFERNELRANDRIRFTLEDGVVQLTAVRRERKRPAAEQQVRRWASMTEPEHRERAQPPSSERSRATDAARHPDLGAGEHDHVVARGAEHVAEFVVEHLAEHVVEQVAARGTAGRQGAAHTSHHTSAASLGAPTDDLGDGVSWEHRAHRHAVGSEPAMPDEPRRPWDSEASTVRAVRRVRIEAGPAPSSPSPAPQPVDRADARQVWARNHHARWRPLDALDETPVEPAEDTGPAYPETTVRVIRRGAAAKAAAEAAPSGRSPVATPPASPPASVPAGADAPTPRAEAPRAPAIARPQPERLHPAPPASTDHEPGNERRGGLLGSLARIGLRLQGEREVRTSSLDAPVERELVPVPVPVAKRMESARSEPPRAATPRQQPRVGPGGAAVEGAVGAARTAAPRSPEHPALPVIVDDDLFGDGFLEMDHAKGFGAVPFADRDAAPAREASGPTPAGAPHAGGHAETPPARLEDDMSLLMAFLARPATPAIVRSEAVALELGMTPERAERALERLSEDREKIDRIRPGAYMVRHGRRS